MKNISGSLILVNHTQIVLGCLPVDVKSLLSFEDLATVEAEAGIPGHLDLRRDVAGCRGQWLPQRLELEHWRLFKHRTDIN